jgi:hypothetical protein
MRDVQPSSMRRVQHTSKTFGDEVVNEIRSLIAKRYATAPEAISALLALGDAGGGV